MQHAQVATPVTERLMAHLQTEAGQQALAAARLAIIETETSIALPAAGLTAYVATSPEAAGASGISHNRNDWVVVHPSDDHTTAVRGQSPEDGKVRVRAFLSKALVRQQLEGVAL